MKQENRVKPVSAETVHERTAASAPSLLSSLHCCLHCHRVNACFLCASVLSGDHCLRAPGPESGRSSPYHSQLDVRSSTPTSYQAPKHFHIPGRLPARNFQHGCMLHGVARHPAPAPRKSRFLGTLPSRHRTNPSSSPDAPTGFSSST